MTEHDKLRVIADVICEHDRVSLADLRKRSRKRTFVEARAKIYHIARRTTRLTVAEMGGFFNRDHATVLNGIKLMNNLIHFNGHKSIIQKLEHEVSIAMLSDYVDMERYVNSMDINF